MDDNVIEITGQLRSPFDRWPANRRGATAIEEAATTGYHAGYDDGWEAGVKDTRLARSLSLALIVVAAFLCGVAATFAVDRWL